MPIATRYADTEWNGPLASRGGVISSQSGALKDLAVSWPARTERPDGKSSPEELAAAAHSSCYSMALALVLGERKREPERLQVKATVTLDEVDGAPTVVSSALEVRGRVHGIEAAEFDDAVAAASELCPISRLFAGAEVSVSGSLAED